MKRFFPRALLILLWLLVTEYSSASSSKCYYDETPQSFENRSVFTSSFSDQSRCSGDSDSIDWFVREQAKHFFYGYDSPAGSVLGNLTGNHYCAYDSATGVWDYVVQNPWSKFDPDGQFGWSIAITAGFAIWDTVQYARGATSGREYAAAMALNGAALAADVVTLGNGGGLAVRAANVAVKAAKVVTKADTTYSTLNGAYRTGKAIAEGDGKGAVINGVLTAVGAKASIPGGKSAKVAKVKNGCFAKGTLVATPEGNVPIEILEIGDEVLAYNFNSGEVVARKIKSTPQNYTFNWVDVKVDGGIVVATRLHRFWVESDQDWKYAIELVIGDVVRCADGKLRVVESVVWRKNLNSELTFNLEVEYDHNFFVGESRVLVHNGDKDKVKPREVRQMKDFPSPQNSKDFSGGKFQRHEMLQASWLKKNGYGGRGGKIQSRNPAMALEVEQHSEVSKNQAKAGLHGDLSGQTAKQNISANIKAGEKAGIPRKDLAKHARKARNFANSLPCP